MGFDELLNKAEGSGMAEKASDAGIEKAGDFVEEKSGGKFDEQIEKGEDAADTKVGGE
jgi:hypothetical protein